MNMYFNSQFSQVPKLDLLAGYLKNAANRMALVKTGTGSDTAVCPTTTSTTWAPNCCDEWQRKGLNLFI